MEMFDSISEILDFAISQELAGNRFYMHMAGRMKNPAMRKVFEDFANEELEHKAKLENMKTSEFTASDEQITDMKISDYVGTKESGPDMDYQDALIYAMKEEKAAFKLYNRLAGMTENESFRKTLLALAQEEAKHKLRLEIEYDDVVLKEN